MSEGEVLEGFLCPVCHQDCFSFTRLHAHFEESHSTEGLVVPQSIKGFLTKAKKKLLSDDEPDRGSPAPKSLLMSLSPSKGGAGGLGEEETDGAQEYQTNNPWNWDPPPPGLWRSHLSYFKRVRSARIDSSVAETNKLLIRLNKLLIDLPSDPVKRKAHERSIVSWAEDQDVPLCPFCARSFSLARRRHHCRLCGGIMCHDCSLMLTLQYAKKLVAPIHQGSGGAGWKEPGGAASGSGVGGAMGSLRAGLRRSGSQGSLNSLLSVVDSIKTEQHFRVCAHCMARLDARDNQVEQRTSRLTLALYYEKLIEYRQQLEKLLPQFIQMADSLRCGETTYSLRDAEECRIKLLKKGDSLNSMANRIKNLGANSDSQEPPGPRQELLLRRIHSTTSLFLKEHILTLPKLPTQEELKQLQERRRREAEARLTAEKEAERQAEARAAKILRRRDKDSPHSTPSHTHYLSSVPTLRKEYTEEQIVVDTGWGADSSAHNVTETDDPLIQQMNIIRNYIKQAKEASRYDNIPLLEANLRELQEEYKKQQHIMHS
ncbi:rabenosyn-5-like isoform X1 [Eriocheir sinensis]|uniref:rabenosyn-5-like isoform X1 n=1 Tax=Eriocheir sinensis TaxID=95602 RepID=UPI0021C5944A|nr:rabenosyn-5-like isoform X1 [Eriocheir sinensis]XP_050730075.1 rabenosyn-5-like isoform X1 [Eriocheir sinensis]XP_050730076.1 rabenosyn-5-like isoform X1 [Eriocheir sinensis]XP_050730077.1 rabenosyn-5-like isoform X1 [Eriocheir sinensis]XP_050730078.1 rabenosyn-5-like isoform X1 [Eriocheir sinensis]XP_050730079.1 rabenosyn-5-like isoform X1 [Eriocheir sinensis]XP_050730080.1 rabenosyn-5-like isoform X1 [Eriocheir sinensis]XP_050730081.1 rabenosyn-5-like isoform X1 [Eriocheir sinensis]XP_